MDTIKLVKKLMVMVDDVHADYNLYKMKKIINSDVSIDTIAEVYRIHGKLEMLSSVMDMILEETKNGQS